MIMSSRCRCGHVDSPGTDHPCHGRGYVCRRPAKRRFYNTRPAALSGMQLKLVGDETWACDACWESYKNLVEAKS